MVPPNHGIGSNDGERVASVRKQVADPTQTNLSTARNGIRFGLPRRKTMICCLSTRTSASSTARDRNRSTTKPKISLQRSHIQRRIVRFSADCQPSVNNAKRLVYLKLIEKHQNTDPFKFIIYSAMSKCHRCQRPSDVVKTRLPTNNRMSRRTLCRPTGVRSVP